MPKIPEMSIIPPRGMRKLENERIRKLGN